FIAQRVVAVEFGQADAASRQGVEPQADHAGLGEALQFDVAYVRCHDGDTAQPVRVVLQAVEHDGVIGSVDTYLDQHSVRHPDGVEHGDVLLSAGRGRRVTAVGDEPRPHHVSMGVYRPGRRAVAAGSARHRVGCGADLVDTFGSEIHFSALS